MSNAGCDNQYMIGTVADWKGQGGYQSHATRGARTLCGRTPSLPRWGEIEPATINTLANVSCNRCRSIMGTLVAGSEAQHLAAAAFLEAAK